MPSPWSILKMPFTAPASPITPATISWRRAFPTRFTKTWRKSQSMRPPMLPSWRTRSKRQAWHPCPNARTGSRRQRPRNSSRYPRYWKVRSCSIPLLTHILLGKISTWPSKGSVYPPISAQRPTSWATRISRRPDRSWASSPDTARTSARLWTRNHSLPPSTPRSDPTKWTRSPGVSSSRVLPGPPLCPSKRSPRWRWRRLGPSRRGRRLQ